MPSRLSPLLRRATHRAMSFSFSRASERGGSAANDPPDPGSFAGRSESKQDRGHVSFKEKLMGSSYGRNENELEDLIESKRARIEFHEGNPCLPEIHFDEHLIEELCDPWRNSLVIKVLGRVVGYQILRRKLVQMWQIQGIMEIIDLDHDYFLVKFSDSGDLEHVLSEGPWLIFDHYLIMQRWTPNFSLASHVITSTLAWVRIPELSILYYRADALKVIATAVGKPIKMDKNTFDASRGRFARLCVEVNLTKPLVPQVFIRGKWHNVEYEGLHKLCFCCGQYGHTEEQCGIALAKKNMASESEESSRSNSNESNSSHFGQWMVASRKRRGGTGKQRNSNNAGAQAGPNMGNQNSTPGSGNTRSQAFQNPFSVLSGMVDHVEDAGPIEVQPVEPLDVPTVIIIFYHNILISF